MENLSSFDLQEYVDGYNCGYYVESGMNEDTIDHALKFPFIRVYSLDRDEKLVEATRERYWYNQRVQVFHRSHETAFYELTRIIPTEYSAVIWFADEFFNKSVEQLARARPAKKDIIVIDNKYAGLSDIVFVSTFFGLTHKIQSGVLGIYGKGLILVPVQKK